MARAGFGACSSTRSELPAHNRVVSGSIPDGPTTGDAFTSQPHRTAPPQGVPCKYQPAKQPTTTRGDNVTVQQELASLQSLQTLDLQNFSTQQELDDIPKAIKEKQQNVEFMRNLLQKDKGRLDEAENWRVETERDLQLQGDMLANSRNKLQAARNERENKAAQREIDSFRKRIADGEKEMLKILEAIEQCRLAYEEHAREFSELEAALHIEEENAKTRIAELQARVDDSAAERTSLAAKIDTPLLRRYERIQSRLGRALVEVVDGKCTGCHFTVLPQLLIELERGEKIISCTNCKRMLYLKPNEPADAGDTDAGDTNADDANNTAN